MQLHRVSKKQNKTQIQQCFFLGVFSSLVFVLQFQNPGISFRSYAVPNISTSIVSVSQVSSKHVSNTVLFFFCGLLCTPRQLQYCTSISKSWQHMVLQSNIVKVACCNGLRKTGSMLQTPPRQPSLPRVYQRCAGAPPQPRRPPCR